MLTEKIIRDAKTDGKTRTVWDAKTPGLGLQITRGGTKNYVIRYAVDGKRRQAIIARAGQISLADARVLAGAELVAIRAGETDPLGRAEERRAAPTVSDLLDKFFGEYVPRRIAAGRMTETTARHYTRQRRYVEPGLGTIKVAEVKRGDVERVLARHAPVHANRIAAFLSRAFTLAEHWELRPQHSNPCRGIEKAREEPRDRVLAPSEVEALAAALGTSTEIFAVAAIRFLMLTGWRSGEALALEWAHVDFETGEALLPSTKAGRQTRPLAAPALALLADMPRVNNNPYVFAGARGVALGYRKLRIVFAGACEAAGLADVRLHDLRRSVATMAAASGLSVLLLRDLLGHRSATMANRYARRAGSALQEAVDASAERMAGMMKGEGATVTPIRKRG